MDSALPTEFPGGLWLASEICYRPSMTFSGTGPSIDQESGHQKKPFLLATVWGEAIALALFAAVITLYGLGSTSLVDNAETRFGLIARNMAETGDWVVPRWSHRPQATKPPFLPLAIAGFSKLAGDVNAWSARMPSALAGVGVVVLTYFLGRQFFPYPVPFIAGLVVCTNVIFYRSARITQTDMLLLFFVLLAAAWVLRGQSREGFVRYLWTAGGYASAGLAMLTKGPVGLLLLGFILLSVTLSRRNWGDVPYGAHIVGLVVAMAVYGSWYWLYQQAAGETVAREVIVRENWQRFFAAFDHRQPFYYFAIVFAGDFMPWTPIFLVGAAWAWVRRKSQTADYGTAVIWFAVIFIFFSLSSSKRNQYILALYPAAAFITAAFLSTAVAPVGRYLAGWRKVGIGVFRGLAVAALALAVVGPIVVTLKTRMYLVPAIAVALPLLILGGWLLRDSFRATLGRVTLIIPMGFLIVHLIVQPIAAPYLERRKSPRPHAQRVAALVGPHHLVSYRFSKASLDFYKPAGMGEVYYIYDWGKLRYFFQYHQDPVFVLMSRKNYESMRPEALVGSHVLSGNLRYRKESLVLLTNRPFPPHDPPEYNGAGPASG